MEKSSLGRSYVHCTLIAIVVLWAAFWLHLVRCKSIPEARSSYGIRPANNNSGLSDIACNYTIVAENGSVNSPGYPNNYPDNRDCWFNITSPKAQDHIYLSFELLDLEHSLDCVFDYLQIFDGHSTDADRLGQYCSTKPESLLQSSSNHILLHFHSDNLMNGKGFVIHFFSGSSSESDKPSVKPIITVQSCPTTGDVLSGMVTSPHYPQYYPSNSNCTSILLAPDGYHILLTFDYLDIEFDDMCLFDYLEVRDGPTSESPLMTLVCGRKTHSYTLGSTANAIYLRFVSDEFVEHRGFKLLYQALPFKDSSDDTVDDEDELLDSESEEDMDLAEWLDYSNELSDGWDLSDPPSIIARPNNATVSDGQSFVLDCYINGSSSAIVWLKDNSIISSLNENDDSLQLLPNNSLMITNMNADTEGVYTCVILSEHGALSLNAWVTLDWNSVSDGDCDLEFRETPRDVMLYDGQNTFLTCYAYEAANITWLKDGEDIENLAEFGKRLQLLIDNVLLINKADVNDSGIYTCLAIQSLTGCIKTVDAVVRIVQQRSVDDVCGRPRIKPEKQRRLGKVVAGNDAERGAYPWQAMLWEQWSGMFCGGSLVNRLWIITAAHCFTEFQQRFSRSIKVHDLLIKLGKHDQSIVEVTEQVVRADTIVIHPNFNASTYDNDIALVRLSRMVHYTESVLPVCLTDDEHQKLYNDSFVIGTLTGWGMMTERGMPSVYLQEVSLPLVPWKTCMKSTKYLVTSNMFCAGYMKQVMGDACHGDSGGPLTTKYDGRWYLLGVVSWGEGCDREGKYGFYTNVGKYIFWLQNTMNNTISDP